MLKLLNYPAMAVMDYLKKSGCIGNVVPHLSLRSNANFIFTNRRFGPWLLHPLVPVHAEASRGAFRSLNLIVLNAEAIVKTPNKISVACEEKKTVTNELEKPLARNLAWGEITEDTQHERF
jgi:hypothetical protein